MKNTSVLRALIAACLAMLPIGAAQTIPRLTEVSAPAAEISRGHAIRTFTLYSALLKERRTIHIGLPGSFTKSAPTRRYPVFVVLDGEENVPPLVAVSAELTRHAQIPEAIVVAIPNRAGKDWIDSGRIRVRDLTPPGLSVSGSSLHEGGDLFLDFIEQELLPAVDKQFRGGLPRVLIGHSSGGILATYAAATRPKFRCVIAIDTPMHFGDFWLAKKLLARARNAPDSLRYTSYEVRFGWSDNGWRELLQAAPSSWRLHREHLDRESHESTGMLAMYLGLRQVFADYSRLSAPVTPTTSILPYYAKVSDELGARVVAPRRILDNLVQDLLMEGRGTEARVAYEQLRAGYGTGKDDRLVREQIATVEKRPPPTETVEGLLAIPFPSPDEVSKYLGDWVGEIWASEDEPHHPQNMSIRIVDGKVVGETTYPDAPPGVPASQWQHLRITPTGLTWGFMSGMRPRGLILFEAKLEGDVLTGDSRIGGVNFWSPDGAKPVPHHFIFRRQRSAR